MSTKTAQINQTMQAREWALLILLSIIWGGSFFFVEILVDHLPPLTIVNVRVAVAALFLWFIVLGRKIPIPKTAKAWSALFIVGLINNAVPFSLLTYGQTQIESGLASIFNAMTPLFTVIIAGAFLADEKMSGGKILGVLIGLVGAVVLIGPEALKGMTGAAWGQLACLFAALSYAVAGVFARRFKEMNISPLVIATGQVSTAALLLLPLTLSIDKPWALPVPGALAIGSLLALSIVCTVIAYLIYFRLIATAGAVNASLVTFLIPVSAVALGVAFLGEGFSAIEILGMVLIFIGLIVMDGRLLGRRSSQ